MKAAVAREKLTEDGDKYRGEIIYDVKVSVRCFLKVALLRGRECKFQNKVHRSFDNRNNFTPVDNDSFLGVRDTLDSK